ncbi:MAG: tetratricopeptide repeat protein [Gemmatimonadaceae bacterium]
MDEQGYDAILTTLRIMPIFPRLAVSFALAVTLAVRLDAQQPARDTGTARPDSALTPVEDQARGVSAELGVALFNLTVGQPLRALDRLEWLRSAPVSQGGSAGVSARQRADLFFLLVQGYYRLGMSPQFRSTAAELMSQAPDTRYTGIVSAELMLDAYRQGDYTRARSLMKAAAAGEDHGLVSLVGGLAAYDAGDFNAARAAFRDARAAGGVYAPYAQYLDAMAAMGGDTARAGQALGVMRSLSQVATGSFGDQVRLTEAQLALLSGQYDAAITAASGVSPSGGLAAQAQLTKAWALYRAGKLDDARVAFTDVAAHYPMLPRRDEARVMAGQALLEARQAAESERYFDAITDSVSSEATLLQSRVKGPWSDAARTLVSQRAAGLLFLDDPDHGRTVALPDAAGAEPSIVAAAYAGAAAPPAVDAPRLITLADVQTRVDSVAPALGADFPRRILYRGVSTPASRAAYATSAEALDAATAAVALARYRLQSEQGTQALQIGALQEFQHLIADSRAVLEENARTVALVRDSLGRMTAVLTDSRRRVHEALAKQVALTKEMATENVAMLDSVKASLGSSLAPREAAVLETEIQTAHTYQQITEVVDSGLDAAIARNPVFALQDSLGVRLARAQAMHDSAAALLADNDRMVSAHLDSLQGHESDRARAMRAILAAAESQRAAAEQKVVSLVEAELGARAASALAALQRDREAAEYGSASAAFFRALESSSAAPGTSSTTGSASSAGANTPPR